jgi:serine protease Do
MQRSVLVPVCLGAAVLLGSLAAGPLVHSQVKPPAVTRDLTSYKDVVKQVLPAVVSIESQAKPVARAAKPKPEGKLPFDDSRIPEEFRKFFEEFGQQPFQTPEEVPHHGFGSGFLVSADGIILTNHHVVQGADEVTVQLDDGRKFTSKEVKSDPKTDLAIVRIHAKSPLPYLELGDSDKAEIGDVVLAVGAPFGLRGTVTQGIISARGRSLHMNMYEDFLQTDAAINPGNSGGPLVNLEGKVVGINSVIKSHSGGFQGIGLAISSNLARNIMQQLQTNGVVHRGYLGIEIRALDPEVAERLGVPNKEGVLVSRVVEGTPAATAGLHDGDVITALDGKRVTQGRDLQQAVAALAAKKTAEVTVFRDGKTLKLPVTIAEQPEDFNTAGQAPSQPLPEEKKSSVRLDKFGLEVADMTRETAAQFGYKDKMAGALITRVDPDGLAARAGLERGTLLVRVEKTPVKSAAEARDALEKASLDSGVLLQVRGPRGGMDYVLLQATAAG